MTDREIDALVAEKVMGLKPGKAHGVVYQDEPVIEYEFPGPKYRQFKPSTDIAAAWMVEEKLREIGAGLMSEYGIALVDLLWDDPPSMDGMFRVGGLGIFSVAHATPRQRCLAALKAVGVEVGA